MSGRQTNTALANTLRAETNKVNSDNGWQGHMADGSYRVDGRDIWQMAVTEQMAETQWTAGMYGG